MRRLLVASVVLSVGAGCGDDTQPQQQWKANCTAHDPSAEAKIPAGKQQDGSVILPGGRRITPQGTLLDVGGFPLAMRVLPGGRYVVVTDGDYGDEALRIVDLQAADPHNAIVSKVDYLRTEESPHAPALFYGMALTADGSRLYVSDGGYDPVPDTVAATQHYNPIDAYDIAGSPPQLTKNDSASIKLFFNPGAAKDGSATPRMPSGIELSSDEKTLYVATQYDDTLAIVDLHPGAGYGMEIGRAAINGAGPYDVAVDENTHTAYVSLWGGQREMADGGFTFADGVIAVDVTDPTKPVAQPLPIATGKGAEAEMILAGKLLVANADADSLSAIDLASHAVTQTAVRLAASKDLIGSSPNAFAADPMNNRFYVAKANENSVEVLDLQTFAHKGSIPTAWYPTAVSVLPTGDVVIASAKGLGLGPTNHEKGKDDYMQGTLSVVPKPADADLASWDKVVVDNLTRPKSYQVGLDCPATGDRNYPLPPDVASKGPIEHVFLVVRENKTYDSLLGDLQGSNGDPSLVLFGSDVTPNLHALAKTFTNLDNFYSNAEQSLQGHEWTTAAFSNDYSEKAWATTWGRAYRPLAAFGYGALEHLADPPDQSAWVHLDQAGVAYHNYGEVVNTTGAIHLYDTSYPGIFFSLGLKDVTKIQYVIDNINDPNFALEPFTYIGLPNDHTYGTTPGKPTPQSMVADNDEATGRLIDALSHSKYWHNSIVFIIEDDPQDGGDHVEGHRSICVAISPWVKRGGVSSVHYDNPSLWATIDTLLGVGPMNGFDGNAAAMYDLFSTTADDTPYTFIPRKIPDGTNSADAPFAAESAKIDWTKPDSAPLGRILWNAIKHREPPWGAMASPRGDRVRDEDGDGD